MHLPCAGDPYLRQHCSFARVNIDRVKPTVRQLGITKIPTVLLLAPDGTTLDTFRASGQAARDALTQQLAAMQLQQQQPSLPSLPLSPEAEGAKGPEDQPAPSEIEDGNGSNGAASRVNGDTGTSDGSNGSSSTAGAACGTVPEPSCGQLLPGVGAPDSAAGSGAPIPSSAGSLPASDQQSSSPRPSATPSSSGVPEQAAGNSSAEPVDEALLAAKQQFLRQYGAQYGYGGWLDQHYQQEIGYRLGPNKHYLDYTGKRYTLNVVPLCMTISFYSSRVLQQLACNCSAHSAAMPKLCTLPSPVHSRHVLSRQ